MSSTQDTHHPIEYCLGFLSEIHTKPECVSLEVVPDNQSASVLTVKYPMNDRNMIFRAYNKGAFSFQEEGQPIDRYLEFVPYNTLSQELCNILPFIPKISKNWYSSTTYDWKSRLNELPSASERHYKAGVATGMHAYFSWHFET